MTSAVAIDARASFVELKTAGVKVNMSTVALQGRSSRIIICSVIAISYILLAKLCQIFAIPPGNITPVWLPSALIFAVALLKGPMIWPGIFVGAFIGNISAYYTGNSFGAIVVDIVAASFNGLGDACGALLAAHLVRKETGTKIPLFSPRDVVVFITQGAFVASAISALAGVTPLWIFGRLGDNSLWLALATWFTGDAVGILIVTPILLIASQKQNGLMIQNLKNVALAFTIIMLCLLGTGVVTDQPIELAIVVLIPILIWAIFYLDYRISYALIVLVATVVVGKAVLVSGWRLEVFALIEMQIFLGIISVTILLTQSLVMERTRANQALEAFKEELIAKLAEQATQLSQQEQEIKQALAFTDTGSWKYDVGANRVTWSDTVERIMGMTPGSFRNDIDHLKALIHPDDLAGWQNNVEQCIKHDTPHDYVFRTIAADGTVRWIHGYGGAKRDASGAVLYMTGLVKDVTSQYQTEMDLRKTLKELNLAVETAKLGIWRFYLDEQKLEWNPTLFEIYNLGQKEFTQDINCWKRKVFPDDLQASEREFEAIMTGKSVYDVEFRILRDENDVRHIQASGAPVFDEHGKITELIGINLDITHMKRREYELAEAASVFENTIEGIMMTDLEGRITQVNPAFENITGYRRQQVIGQTCRVLKSGRHDHAYYQAMWSALLTDGYWKGEIYNRKQSGEIYPELLTISTTLDQHGKPLGYVAVFSDISQLKASEDRLNFLAHHDPLTQLPNRLLLGERLQQSIRQAVRHNTKLGLIFIDIDHFKEVNDSFGHLVGDALLRTLAERLRTHLRATDTAARISGDEFIVLLEDVHTQKDIQHIIEKLFHAIKSPMTFEQHELRITVSLGVAIFPDNGQEADLLMSHADSAMYAAKKDGRNNYRFYTEDMTKMALDHVIISNALQTAIDNNEFSLRYQPQINAKDGGICGIEVLLRWHNKALGTVPPAAFLPVADKAGLMREIGQWVLEQACLAGRMLLDQKIDCGRIAVNIAGSQIAGGDLVANVQRALTISALPAHYLELEVIESFIMQQAEQSIDLLAQLGGMGVQIAIDDFGTGYSSLSYLKQLPIDKLKIDQSFIRDIPKDQDDMAITRAIVSMGHALNLRVIAEGVETASQMSFVNSLLCDEIQGYYISKPLTFEAFIEFLKSHPKICDAPSTPLFQTCCRL